ncbi:hypothetical protein A8924_3411 [Saccharopolyspora erythraea NRRL 2338]|uniref:PE-PGRS family protein n=2 Tax=Saccharopolyspora erythraea TaxID=1836 RepID=A4FE22_SACEN|nr:hypothetical protein N599_28675 [Saccharopolyspora erythraea D]PFG96024.1 hypothetical protein A8924_3411 [Saccharopolyspora erythraea NRRL 2338]QRK93570.1 hypothetical protein JQX30_15515 [Saccharopolyspora erythraea]CAM02297.1 PE-PGRS family protein [Saccharopolyspora erythraea NRRL 2338]
MSHEISLFELEDQRVEFLPARTVLTMFAFGGPRADWGGETNNAHAGDGGNGGGHGGGHGGGEGGRGGMGGQFGHGGNGGHGGNFGHGGTGWGGNGIGGPGGDAFAGSKW